MDLPERMSRCRRSSIMKRITTATALILMLAIGYSIGVYVAACEFRADRYSLRYAEESDWP